MSQIKPSEGHVFIATYGSLRRDMENFRVNSSGGGKFVGKGQTVNNYDLFRFGGGYFPSVSLKHSESDKPVVVDVFIAPESGLHGAYDCLEGYPHFYDRTPVDILMDNGDTLTAWIYHIDEVQPTRVESGDWCTYKRGEAYYENLESDNDAE